MPYAQSVPGFDLEALPDGLVLRSRSGSAEYHLDRTAGLIYAFCDGRTATCEIARQLRVTFADDAPPREDVERVIAELQAMGVVEVHTSVAAA